jgi:hypothetical protein
MSAQYSEKSATRTSETVAMQDDTRLWDKLEDTRHLPREERVRIMAELVEQIRKERKEKESQEQKQVAKLND